VACAAQEKLFGALKAQLSSARRQNLSLPAAIHHSTT
jgi:hypothetical protein